MSGPNSAFGSNAGIPNLSAAQRLQEEFTPTVIDSLLRVEVVNIAAAISGTGGVSAENIPQGAEIIDVLVQAKATVGSGTAQVKVGGGGAAISDAITMAVEDAIARASTIDQTYKIVGADGIEVVTNSDSDQGDVYIYYKK
jgi:hypothetical protein